MLLCLRIMSYCWPSPSLYVLHPRIRSGVLSVPSRCRQQAPHFSTRDVALIDAELRRILDELAGGGDA